MKEKKLLLIVNPRAGKGRIRNHLLGIADLYAQSGYELQLSVTQAQGDTAATVRRFGPGSARIVCCGGDGTLSETISGILELDKAPCLGYIPCGSTNDFAATLCIPKRFLPVARIAIAGSEAYIDTGLLNGARRFLYIAGFGAFTEVSYLTSQDWKNRLGHQAYILESLRSLAAIRSYHMVIEGSGPDGGKTLEGEFIFGMVTNSTSVAGIRGLAGSGVSLDDGLFEVLLVRMPRTPRNLSELISGLLREEGNGMVHRLHAGTMRVRSTEAVDWVVDGEFGGNYREVFVENMTKSLKICRKMPETAAKSKNYPKQVKKNVEI